METRQLLLRHDSTHYTHSGRYKIINIIVHYRCLEYLTNIYRYLQHVKTTVAHWQASCPRWLDEFGFGTVRQHRHECRQFLSPLNSKRCVGLGRWTWVILHRLSWGLQEECDVLSLVLSKCPGCLGFAISWQAPWLALTWFDLRSIVGPRILKRFRAAVWSFACCWSSMGGFAGIKKGLWLIWLIWLILAVCFQMFSISQYAEHVRRFLPSDAPRYPGPINLPERPGSNMASMECHRAVQDVVRTCRFHMIPMRTPVFKVVRSKR